MRTLFILLLIPAFSHSQSGQKVTIFFPYNSEIPEASSKILLDSILMGKKISSVSIDSYCDAKGNESYNDELSQRRALAIKKIFLLLIPEDSIKAMPHGKHFQLNDNKTEQKQRLNRRAEIQIRFVENVVLSSDTIRKQDNLPEADTSSNMFSDFDRAEIGSSIQLLNINFYDNRHKWLPRSESAVKQLLEVLQKYPGLEIEIQGHICCKNHGDAKDLETGKNELSVNRAKAIYDYLIVHGISASRLSYKGFGADKKLIKKEKNSHDQLLNRRVEIVVKKK